jgi:CheY-like chemotaxis protein
LAKVQRERRLLVSRLPGFELKPRVLVADDDITTGSLLSSLASSENFEVVTVRDGAQAYRLLKVDSDFQAVVVNPAMPHIEGVEIVRYMKTENRLKRIPVVIVTAENMYQLVTDCFAAGAIAFLCKPFKAHQLWNTVQMLMGPALAKRKAA